MNYDHLAQMYGLSRAAVIALVEAIRLGGGRQAKWNHPELGGTGQWQPGMVIIGDMFNATLRAKLEQLCATIAAMDTGRATPIWWDARLGKPALSGGQSNLHYAYFPDHRELHLRLNGKTLIYDTGDHVITGVMIESNQLRFLTPHKALGLEDFSPVPV
ncbi:MAG: hypothetical protein OHK0023_01160 [Anaerolineae bacterium]